MCSLDLSKDGEDGFEAFLADQLPLLERLRVAAVSIIHEVLLKSEIEFLPILSRVKDPASAAKKQKDKKYTNPMLMMTDLVGIRVILLLETDIDKSTAMLRECFQVDERNSVDKRTSLKSNEFGYKSVHLVCSLGRSRQSLPEYKQLFSMKFEVQIRTALQHTWAEIEHKRNYKGKSALPPDLERRLNAASAALELVDREFAEIAKQVDQYSMRVAKNDRDVQGDPITGAGLVSIYRRTVGSSIGSGGFPISMAVSELRNFGINTISDVEKLLKTKESVTIINETKDSNDYRNPVGFYIQVMLANDPERYLSKSYGGRWSGISRQSLEALKKATGNSNILDTLKEHGISDY